MHVVLLKGIIKKAKLFNLMDNDSSCFIFRYINTDHAKAAIKNNFSVSYQKCKKNIDLLKVRFSDSNHSDVPDGDKLSLSWIVVRY